MSSTADLCTRPMPYVTVRLDQNGWPQLGSYRFETLADAALIARALGEKAMHESEYRKLVKIALKSGAT